MLKKIITKLFKDKNKYKEFSKVEKYEKKYKQIINDIDNLIKKKRSLIFYTQATVVI